MEDRISYFNPTTNGNEESPIYLNNKFELSDKMNQY
jgi:hypothetical protein